MELNLLYPFLSAVFFAFLATPLVILLANKFRFLDFPWRTHPAILHQKPIPRAGGVATYIAIVVTYLLFLIFSPYVVADKHILGLLLAGLLVVIVGALDDKYDLNPYVRLITNFVAAGIVVASGVGITWFTNPFGGQVFLDIIIFSFNFPSILPFGFLTGTHTIVLLADIFAFIWIVWVMNALNWSSGVDGQLSGIAAIGLVTLGFASYQYLVADPSQLAPALISFISAGAYIGFLPWSFYPQKIMPGYGGATLAGMILASVSILAGAKLATTGLLLIVPMIDAVWAVVRRVVSGRSPVWGDRYHLHHHLLALGLSKRQVAFFYYILGAGFAILSLTLDHKGRFFAISVAGVVILAILVTVARIARQHEARVVK